MINIIIIILIIIKIFVITIRNIIIVITPPDLQLISSLLLARTMLFITYTLYVAILELLSFLFRESPFIIVTSSVCHFTVDVYFVAGVVFFYVVAAVVYFCSYR